MTVFTCQTCRLSLPVSVWPLRCRCGSVYDNATAKPIDVLSCVHRGQLIERLTNRKECGCGNEGVEVWYCNKFNETVLRRKVTRDGRKRVESEHNFSGRYCLTCPARISGLRLLRKPESIIGRNYHRSGWPYAIDSMSHLLSDHGMAFEDFAEHRFCYDSQPKPILQQWVGVFHHPPNMPSFANPSEMPHVYLRGEPFQQSLRHLSLAICMSEYQAAGFRELLPDTQVVAIKHPTGPGKPWQRTERLLQVGHYLRNTRAIHLVRSPIRKLKVLTNRSWIKRWDRICEREFGTGEEVETIGYIPNDGYDELLSTSVVVTHLIDASANNVVVECIRRNTPLLINRHPAAVEYLGEDYPLFWDSLDTAGALLTNELIIAAHRYLIDLPKDWIEGEAFANSVMNAVVGIT